VLERQTLGGGCQAGEGMRKIFNFSVKRRGDSEAHHALRDGGTPEVNLGSPMESGAKRGENRALARKRQGAEL